MRRTKEEAAETRQALLDAALRVFSRQGYAGTRLEDVAAEADMTRGAIYWHFKSKAHLYNTLVAEVSIRAGRAAELARIEGGDPLENFRRIMIRMLELVEEDTQYRAVLELTLLKTELTPELEGGMQIKVEAIRAGQAQLEDVLRRGIERGLVRRDLEPAEGARACFSLVNGAVMLWLLDPGAFSLKASAPALVEVYVRGIAAQPRNS
jgi:TetR/AcrR family acrAB operon transcriptional repressor